MSRPGDNCKEHDLPIGACIECVGEELAEATKKNRHRGYKIVELEDEINQLRMRMTAIRTQATNAITELENGDIEEAIDALRQVTWDK